MLEPLIYGTYVQILKDELLPAMGCTEPIAVAYAAAIARQALGQTPDRVTIEVSRNIIKNVKSVVVPHTGGMRGLEAACAAGIVAGRADKELEVISDVTPQQISQIQQYVNETPITVDFAKSDLIFDIAITVCHGEESAFAGSWITTPTWSASARGTRCCCPRRSPARPRVRWPTNPS